MGMVFHENCFGNLIGGGASVRDRHVLFAQPAENSYGERLKGGNMRKRGNANELAAPTWVTRRGRVRRRIGNGGRILGDKTKGVKVIMLLNQALALEMICILRYKHHYFMAAGISSFSPKAEFLPPRHGRAGPCRSLSRTHCATWGRAEFISRNICDPESPGIC